jgi:alpha-L-fucosidase
VPAFGNEWYPRQMYQPDTKEYKHHIETYGPQKEFGYKDFLPMFKAEEVRIRTSGRTFSRNRARNTSCRWRSIHDGFQKYRSDICRWNAYEMGPKRDICGELADAVRRKAWCSARPATGGALLVHGRRAQDRQRLHAELEDFYGPAQSHPEKLDDAATAFPDAEHLNDWLVRTCEIVDRFHPQLVWFDWWINNNAFRPYLEKFAAYYYNRAAQWAWRSRSITNTRL